MQEACTISKKSLKKFGTGNSLQILCNFRNERSPTHPPLFWEAPVKSDHACPPPLNPPSVAAELSNILLLLLSPSSFSQRNQFPSSAFIWTHIEIPSNEGIWKTPEEEKRPVWVWTHPASLGWGSGGQVRHPGHANVSISRSIAFPRHH